MTLLNWLPELFLLVLLFCTLLVINFRVLSYRSLSIGISIFTTLGLGYYLFRTDLAYFESPLKILYSDSLSHFGRILSLVSLVVFSLSFHFHRRLNFAGKQRTNLFLLFYAFFTIAMFEANNLVFFLGAALGIYFSSMNLILIESDRDELWIRLFRQKTQAIGLWAILMSLIFVAGSKLFGSVYISDWVSALPHYGGNEFALFAIAFLIVFSSAIPIGGLRYVGKAPIGIAVMSYSLFIMMSTFWLRLGIPFFSLSPLLTKSLAQDLVSIVIGGFALRYAWFTVKTREHHRWYASALPTVVGLSLFLILLPGAQALPAFYCISLSLVFTFVLVAQAFLDEDYRHKSLLVFGLVTLLGLAPFILGEQFYRIVRDSVAGGNILAGVLMTLSWFGLSVGVMQKISHVLLVRMPVKDQRKVFVGEFFVFAVYLICVIALTAFRPEFVAYLNEHPALNLW